MPGSSRPLVTIVMPALNEERYIASAIASLLPDETGEFSCELLVVDGGSSDATAKIVTMLARGHDAIRLVSNERRVQSAGVNLAARLADPRSEVLVRADCHAGYPPDFVQTCVRALRGSGASSVVVPMLTRGTSCMQRAVAAAQNSRLGNGGSAHRIVGKASRFVDHGHHAAFDRQVFLELGGYDESFTANEDAEFDRRLVAGGGRIWMADDAAITYYPRSDLLSLARQYSNYGAGRARTAATHKAPLKLRQLMPAAAFMGCMVSTLLAAADARFLAVDACYVALCLAWGLMLAARARSPCLLLSGPAAMVMHMAWGFGFVRARLARTAWPPPFKAAASAAVDASAP